MYLYKLLGINDSANSATIKKRYRELAKMYHPDICDDIGTDVRFLAIKKAYEILSDEYQKNLYLNSHKLIKDCINSDKLIDDIKKKYNEALKKDLGLLIDIGKDVSFNRDLLKVDLIHDYTIIVGIDSKEILDLFEKIEKDIISKMPIYNVNNITLPSQNMQKKDTVVTYDKKKSSSKTKILLLLAFIILVIVVFNDVTSNLNKYNETKSQAIAEYEKEQKLINDAINDPTLYWDFDPISPQEDGRYLLVKAWDYSSNSYYQNQYCLVIGVKAYKETNSKYYLSNSYDGGQLSVSMDDFSINFVSPSTTKYDSCLYLFDDYNIEIGSQFIIKDGETKFLLFKMYNTDLSSSMSLKYKGFVVY